MAHHIAHWDAVCLQVLGPIGVPTATSTLVPRPTRTPLPGEPTASPGPGTREARAAVVLADLLATATALADRPPPVLITRPTTASATAARVIEEDVDGVAGALRKNLGLVFLGLGALAGALLLSAAKSGSASTVLPPPAPPTASPPDEGSGQGGV
jgi:hypothetical protein